MRSILSKRVATRVVLTLAAIFGATEASACPVCFGKAEAPILAAAESSVLLMIGVTYGLLGLGLTLFIVLRRRAKRLTAAETTRFDHNAAQS